MNIKHIKPLTSMRFIFCLMVFLSHITDLLNNSDKPQVRMISSNIFSEGYIGVSFFFILSGFILSYAYQERVLTNKISDYEFIINRDSLAFLSSLFIELSTVSIISILYLLARYLIDSG